MKVNYLKEWGNDGTVYKQTITIEKEYIKKFNELARAEKEEIGGNRTYEQKESESDF